MPSDRSRQKLIKLTMPAVTAPVVLLAFNRPALTQKVLDALRLAQPSRLLLVADGPRAGHPADAQACARVRALLDKGVDWPAEVSRNYAPQNLGLRRRVSSGLTWAFQQVDEAIILEDDCIPDSSFFLFCTELLEHFKADSRVGVITGNNFQPPGRASKHSYYFSRFNHCWGWATWRRAWRLFDGDMAAWPELKASGWLDGLFPEAGHARYWSDAFDRAYERRIDSWAFCWTFSCWSQNLLTAIPKSNLVSNIGFGPGSTHTTDPASPLANLPARAMDFPLSHPATMVRDHLADDYSQRTVFGSISPGSVSSEAASLENPGKRRKFFSWG